MERTNVGNREAACEAVLDFLHTCITPWGLAASGDRGGYHNLWARDSMITALGMLETNDEALIAAVRTSLLSLSAHQTELGLIPNKIDFGDVARVNFRAYADGGLWFVLIVARFVRRYPRDNSAEDMLQAARQVLQFMRYQDHDQSGLVSIDEGSTWMDLFPLRGKSIYVNALRYWATCELAETIDSQGGEPDEILFLQKEAQNMRDMIHKKLWYEPGKDMAILLQDSFSTSSYDEQGIDALGRKMLLPPLPQFSDDGYFLAYLTLRDYGDWFDTLGNIIAILSGVATDVQSRQILSFIETHKLSQPYPVSAMHPPLKEGDKDWRYYFAFGDLNQPHHYHNGGSWPMIGGLYVSALNKVGDTKRAQTVLEKLIKTNTNTIDDTWLFPEHRHGVDGQPHGMSDQAWSAGTLLYALHSMKS